MKILIADKFPKHWLEVLQKNYSVTYEPSLDDITLPANIKDNDVLIVRSTKVKKDTLEAAEGLKLIIRAGAGFDTIDTAFAKQKGIGVCNCPGTNSLAVAELAMGLLLALDRRIYDNVKDLREGKWNKSEYGKARGLYGRTLAVFGIGNIGRQVAKRAAAFGMSIAAYDPYAAQSVFESIDAKKYDDIYAMAAEADAITVHLPDTEETKGMFDKKFFDAMKDGAIFVNTARGSLVVTKDLREAVKTKKIKAALDVYENEPKAADVIFDKSLFDDAPTLYGTHHIGASTDQAQDAVAEMAVEIVERYAKTKEFLHKVN